MAVSLKAMWNLNHVMQVVAFLRLISNNPANLKLVFDSVYDAVTLKPIKIVIFEYGEGKFDLAKQKVNDDTLIEMDIRKDSIIWSLGIFFIVLILLIMTLFFYYVIRLLRKRVGKFQVVEKYLEKKLFYSSIIRYLITSNLKLGFTCFFFLVYVGTEFKDWRSATNSTVNLIILTILLIWPLYMTLFLLSNRKLLDSEKFK